MDLKRPKYSKLSLIFEVFRTISFTLLFESHVILYVNHSSIDDNLSKIYWLLNETSSLFINFSKASLNSEISKDKIFFCRRYIYKQMMSHKWKKYYFHLYKKFCNITPFVDIPYSYYQYQILYIKILFLY